MQRTSEAGHYNKYRSKSMLNNVKRHQVNNSTLKAGYNTNMRKQSIVDAYANNQPNRSHV